MNPQRCSSENILNLKTLYKNDNLMHLVTAHRYNTFIRWHILIQFYRNKSYFMYQRVDVRGLAERAQLPDECGCSTPIRRGRQRCVEIIKPSDLWPFHEFARYLLGTSVSPRCIQFSFGYTAGSVSQNRWYSLPHGSRLQTGKVQSPEVDVQQSATAFYLHPQSFLAHSVPLRYFLASLSLDRPPDPSIPSFYFSSSRAQPPSLSTALLSGVAPSRVHPIPVFN